MPLESEYTEPRLDVPHPEWWNAYDSMAPEVEVVEFVSVLVRTLQPEFVMETGTWKGFTAQSIGKSLLHNGHGHLVTLELDPKRAEEAETNVEGLPVRVEVADSREYVPRASIDLLWLDGSTDRASEWRHLSQYMTEYGIVVIHDTRPEGNTRTQFESVSDITLVHLPTPRGVSIGQKH